MWCGRAAGNEIEVRFFNASGSDLKIVAPGSAGGALRVVRSGVELPSPAPAVFDDEIDAVVRMRPGTTHEVRVAGKFPAGPVTVVYDTRGEGLPEGVWKGRTVFSTR